MTAKAHGGLAGFLPLSGCGTKWSPTDGDAADEEGSGCGRAAPSVEDRPHRGGGPRIHRWPSAARGDGGQTYLDGEAGGGHGPGVESGSRGMADSVPARGVRVEVWLEEAGAGEELKFRLGSEGGVEGIGLAVQVRKRRQAATAGLWTQKNWRALGKRNSSMRCPSLRASERERALPSGEAGPQDLAPSPREAASCFSVRIGGGPGARAAVVAPRGGGGGGMRARSRAELGGMLLPTCR
jgi:hypothetical protein